MLILKISESTAIRMTFNKGDRDDFVDIPKPIVGISHAPRSSAKIFVYTHAGTELKGLSTHLTRKARI